MKQIKGIACVLNTWAEVREQTSDNEICVENVILWNNKHILIDGKSVYWKEWHEAGILRIKDLLDEKNRFLTLNKFLLKTGLKAPFTKLFGLISAIPYRWKCALRPGFIMNNQDMEQNTTKEINVVTSKKVRNILIQRKFVEPLASLRLCRQGLDSSKLSSIYSGAPARAKRARSGAPWVRKFGKLSIPENLVMT